MSKKASGAAASIVWQRLAKVTVENIKSASGPRLVDLARMREQAAEGLTKLINQCPAMSNDAVQPAQVADLLKMAMILMSVNLGKMKAEYLKSCKASLTEFFSAEAATQLISAMGVILEEILPPRYDGQQPDDRYKIPFALVILCYCMNWLPNAPANVAEQIKTMNEPFGQRAEATFGHDWRTIFGVYSNYLTLGCTNLPIVPSQANEIHSQLTPAMLRALQIMSWQTVFRGEVGHPFSRLSTHEKYTMAVHGDGWQEFLKALGGTRRNAATGLF